MIPSGRGKQNTEDCSWSNLGTEGVHALYKLSVWSSGTVHFTKTSPSSPRSGINESNPAGYCKRMHPGQCLAQCLKQLALSHIHGVCPSFAVTPATTLPMLHPSCGVGTEGHLGWSNTAAATEDEPVSSWSLIWQAHAAWLPTSTKISYPGHGFPSPPWAITVTPSRLIKSSLCLYSFVKHPTWTVYLIQLWKQLYCRYGYYFHVNLWEIKQHAQLRPPS